MQKIDTKHILWEQYCVLHAARELLLQHNWSISLIRCVYYVPWKMLGVIIAPLLLDIIKYIDSRLRYIDQASALLKCYDFF